ncbi:MAG TPA: hypothetical protein VE914_00705 [Candidatus Angelobacter sp.]|nr:hypothetical protein [Candidatus Angelobacter sp.]
MSFELYVQCFEQGESSSFPRDVVDRVFTPVVIRRSPESIDIQYGALNSSTIYMAAEGDLSDFMVHRPCGDRRLFQALLEILRSGALVLYWPGGPPLIGRPETADQLPPDLVHALGKPIVVESPEAIMTAIEQS